MSIVESERRNVDGVAKTRQVILTVTRHCNLNCCYCYESHKEKGKRMSLETAKQILEREFEYASNDGITTALDISFMGGEPLEEFNLIRDIAEWVWSKEWPLPYELSLPTNGTLLTDEMREWFTTHRDLFSVGLSFDGLAGVNEINRTTLPIDVRYFIETWPDRRVAVVLFRDSIQHLSENVRHMNNERIPFTVVFGDGFEWTEKDVQIYEDEMGKLINDYLDLPEEAVQSGLFSLNLLNYYPPNKLYEIPFCGAVDNIVNYDYNGEPYICHIFAPATLGQEKADLAREKYKNLKKLSWDLECDQCSIRNTCKPCFGFHEKLFGDVNCWSSKKTICRIQKAKARMCALYQLKRIERKLINEEVLLDEEIRISEIALRYLNESVDLK